MFDVEVSRCGVLYMGVSRIKRPCGMKFCIEVPFILGPDTHRRLASRFQIINECDGKSGR